MTDLSTLVDDLPTESLDLYVMHFEAGEVGGYANFGNPLPGCPHVSRRCPCASLGFSASFGSEGDHPDDHPAHQIEWLARNVALPGSDNRLDTAALYDECLRALIEREQEVRALQGRTPERVTVGAA